MAQVKITVNGQELPCRPTMGAMLRFKQETGKEATDIKDSNVSDLLTYLYCCIVSACNHDKIQFDMSLMDFADSIGQTEMMEWINSIQAAPTTEGEEKKSL